MAKATIGFGVALILLGLGAYGYALTTPKASITALIPAFFGLPLAVCGAIALNENRRKHAMHAAVVLGVLGVIGTFKGLMKSPQLFGGWSEMDRPVAVLVQAIMAILMIIFVVMCVNSFIQARRGPGAATPSPEGADGA